MIQSLESVVRQHAFFKGFTEPHIQFMVGCAKNVRFDQGQYIFREGDAADQFYFIREGLVSIEFMVPQKRPATVQTIGEGDVLGWSWMTAPYRWHFDARALHKTQALAFDGECLRAKCEEDHDLGYEILKRLTNVVMERLDATRLQLLDLYSVHA
jgi:CRP/FNR family transcriptional regulator, cyclic AMP receptor protein